MGDPKRHKVRKNEEVWCFGVQNVENMERFWGWENKKRENVKKKWRFGGQGAKNSDKTRRKAAAHPKM